MNRPEFTEPQEVARLREEVDAHIDALRDELIELNDWMYENPEPGFMEFQAVDKLTAVLAQNGFEVERGVPNLDEVWPDFDRHKYVAGLPEDYDGPPGMPTAFRAKYVGKIESPVIGIVVEYDALRGNPPFHGCQHNMQGPTGLGAAIALARVMEQHDLPGSVWVIGAPAEEVGPPAKAALARAGYIDGVDFAMRTHGVTGKNETVRSGGGFSARHIEETRYTFHGSSAHAQQAWEGVSALDAVMLLFHAMEMMREHSEPQFRFHGIVTEGGVAPNIVPEKASALIWVRHLIDETPICSVSPMEARAMIKAKLEQLHQAARGCAMATGTTVDIEHYGSYVPSIAVGALNELIFQYAVEYGGINIRESSVPHHFEETGFMSLKVPGARVSLGVEGIPETPGHSQESADVTITPRGHDALILLAKVMAASGLRLVMDPEVRKEIKEEHAMWLEKYHE